MDTNNARIHRKITLDVLQEQGRPIAVEAELGYDVEEPFAIRILFSVPGQCPVVWFVDREFLAEGMRRQVKEGVTQVCPLGESITIVEVEGHGPRLVCLMPSAPVVEFIESTNRLVPAGTESDLLDLDAAFETLVANETR